MRINHVINSSNESQSVARKIISKLVGRYKNFEFSLQNIT